MLTPDAPRSRVLSALGPALLLCATTGCWSFPAVWKLEELPLAVDDDLDAVLIDDSQREYDPTTHIVGASGLVLRIEEDLPRLQRPLAVDLRGVARDGDGRLFVVGSEGAILESADHGASWEHVSSGTDSALNAVTVAMTDPGETAVAVGDDVVLVRGGPEHQWLTVPPPGDGWGRLLAVHAAGFDTVAVGRDGTMWRTRSADGPWTREHTGTTADLHAVGRLPGRTADAGMAWLVAGDGGLLLAAESDAAFQAIDTDVADDFVAIAGSYLLTADGHVYDAGELLATHDLQLIGNAALPARAMAYDFQENSVGEIGGGTTVLTIVGERGRAMRFKLVCEPRCDE